MKTFVARNVEELEPILEAFLEAFPSGGQFRLEGEMGAGKTTFISALCRKLGIIDASSPTFSLVNEYVDAQGRSVYHYDLYRLRNLEEALDVGLDVMVDRPGYHFIEWPQVVDRLLDATTVSIEVSDDRRVIKF